MRRIKRVVFRCLLNIIRSVFGVGMVVLLSIASIKCCLMFALSHTEEKLIVEAMPLLQRIVWPCFLLLIVFYFKSYWTRILGEIPGLVSRSYLPHSPPPPVFDSGRGCNDIVGVLAKEDETFDKTDHRREVSKVIDLLEKEYGVKVYSEVKVKSSGWRADGAFLFSGRQYYVAILPARFLESISVVLERVRLIQTGGGDESVFIVYVYGHVDDEIRLAAGRPTNVIIRLGE